MCLANNFSSKVILLCSFEDLASNLQDVSKCKVGEGTFYEHYYVPEEFLTRVAKKRRLTLRDTLEHFRTLALKLKDLLSLRINGQKCDKFDKKSLLSSEYFLLVLPTV